MRQVRNRFLSRGVVVLIVLLSVKLASDVRLPDNPTQREAARRRGLARIYREREAQTAESLRSDLHSLREYLRAAIGGERRPEAQEVDYKQGAGGSEAAVTQGGSRRLWVRDALFSAMGVWDHAAESAWYASLRRKYEATAGNASTPLAPDPPKPNDEVLVPFATFVLDVMSTAESPQSRGGGRGWVPRVPASEPVSTGPGARVEDNPRHPETDR